MQTYHCNWQNHNKSYKFATNIIDIIDSFVGVHFKRMMIGGEDAHAFLNNETMFQTLNVQEFNGERLSTSNDKFNSSTSSSSSSSFISLSNHKTVVSNHCSMVNSNSNTMSLAMVIVIIVGILSINGSLAASVAMNQSAIEESSINHLSPILTTTTVASSTVDQQQQQPELQPMSIISNGNNQQIIGMKHKRDLVDSLINHGPLFQQVNNDDDDGELVEEQQKENEKVKNKIKQEWLNKILLKMALQPTIDRLKQQQQERENNVWLNNEITDYDVAVNDEEHKPIEKRFNWNNSRIGMDEAMINSLKLQQQKQQQQQQQRAYQRNQNNRKYQRPRNNKNRFNIKNQSKWNRDQYYQNNKANYQGNGHRYYQSSRQQQQQQQQQKMLGNNRYRTSKLMVSKPTPTISGDGVWFKGRWIPKAKMSSNNNDIMIQTSTSSTLYKNRTSSINEDENKFVDDRRLHRPEIDDEGAVYGKTIRRGMRETGGKKLYDVPQIECPSSDSGIDRFACPSPDIYGRFLCIDDQHICNGYMDCPKGEDEDTMSCMFYKSTKAHLDVLADYLLQWARGRHNMKK